MPNPALSPERRARLVRPRLAALRAFRLSAIVGLFVLNPSGCAWISDHQLHDRLDADGDGTERPDDCDDQDPNVGPRIDGFIDHDGDGFGSDQAASRCPAEGTVVSENTDCDDANAEVLPGAPELCNGVDDDCDGMIDDGVDVPTWYVDADGDTYGNGADPALVQCAQPVGYADNAADCNDADPLVNPTNPWYPDRDADGYGDPDGLQASCSKPVGSGFEYLVTGGDCDDNDPAVNPGGVEVCDAADIDEDCDGLSDDVDASVTGPFQTVYADLDADGLGDAFAAVQACDVRTGQTVDGSDCDDADVRTGAGTCPFVDVQVGDSVACALRSDGSATCWGYWAGAVPPGRYTRLSAPWEQCGLTTAGTLACWDPDHYSTPVAADVPAGGSWVSVAVGSLVACAVTATGEVSCWGANRIGDFTPPSGVFQSVVACIDHACVLAADGTATCWGYYGSTADWAGIPVGSPTGSWDSLALSDYEGAGLSGGSIAFWGDCHAGACDDTGSYTQISGGPLDHYCGVTPEGRIHCWGRDTFGVVSGAPTGAGFIQVGVGEANACAIDTEGAITCWGTGSSGVNDGPS